MSLIAFIMCDSCGKSHEASERKPHVKRNLLKTNDGWLTAVHAAGIPGTFDYCAKCKPGAEGEEGSRGR